MNAKPIANATKRRAVRRSNGAPRNFLVVRLLTSTAGRSSIGHIGAPRDRYVTPSRQKPVVKSAARAALPRPNDRKRAALPLDWKGCNLKLPGGAGHGLQRRTTTMALLTLKVMAGLLQLQGTGAQIQSDHPGIKALLDDMHGQPNTQAQ